MLWINGHTTRLHAGNGVLDTLSKDGLVDWILEPWLDDGESFQIAVHTDASSRGNTLRKVESDGEDSSRVEGIVGAWPASWTSCALHLKLH